MASDKKYIIIDADVIIHFFKGERITDIHKIFDPVKIKVFDKVLEELEQHPQKKKQIENLLKYKLMDKINIGDFEDGIVKEYFHINKVMLKGKGESACLALGRHKVEAIIASSNTKDVGPYCKMHNLNYLTTMDFLCRALEKAIFTEQECDDFIRNVKEKGSKLPVNIMSEYICKPLTFI